MLTGPLRRKGWGALHYKRLQPNKGFPSLGRRYTSASVRITSGGTLEANFPNLPQGLLRCFCAPANVFSLMGTGKSHTELSPVNRGMLKHIGVSFGEEFFYQLGSMCLCVVMQKIPVVTLPELRSFTTK
ncbi:hypothetical protein TNCV_1522311 [Trichonephila clavipes]|nr:hypothetical protein TNCV_1522311 [Trichonephila clavipes]